MKHGGVTVIPRWVVGAVTAAATLLLAAGTGPSPAAATFPGSNGLIAFQREAPAGDHTQTDVFTVGPDGTGRCD